LKPGYGSCEDRVAAWSTRFSLDVDEEQQNIDELPGLIGVAIDPAG